MFSIVFLDAIFGLNWYQEYIYIKTIHNPLTMFNGLAFVLLPIYGLVRIVKYGDTKNVFNYLAILGSCLYLYPIYIEVVVNRAF